MEVRVLFWAPAPLRGYLFWLNPAEIGLSSTVVALENGRLCGGDAEVSRALATVTGLGALLSALVLAAARAPYRPAMAGRAV